MSVSHPVVDVVYWVVTSESFSTVILSLDSKVETRSSGSSALVVVLVCRLPPKQQGRGRENRGHEYVRETFDQLELVCDLATLGLDILLRLLEVLRGCLGLESDLRESAPSPFLTLYSHIRCTEKACCFVCNGLNLCDEVCGMNVSVEVVVYR